MVRASAQAEALAGLRTPPGCAGDLWNRLSEADRLRPKVALAAARSFVRLGGDQRGGVEILAAEPRAGSGIPRPSRRSPTAVPPIPPGSSRPRSAGSRSTATTRRSCSLGRLCERAVVGKAQTYYEASLALDDHWRAHVLLGNMLRAARARR